MRGAHRDGQIRVARIVDGNVLSSANGAARKRLVVAVTGIAGRDDDHHAGADQPVDFHAKRALPAGEPFRLEIVANTHVDAVHTDTPAAAVEFLNVFQRRNQIAGKTIARHHQAPSG